MGSVFKPKAPKQSIRAPEIPQNITEVEEPQLGAETTSEKRKSQGKRGLKIERAVGAGRNVV